jgi:hypothetical protein
MHYSLKCVPKSLRSLELLELAVFLLPLLIVLPFLFLQLLLIVLHGSLPSLQTLHLS